MFYLKRISTNYLFRGQTVVPVIDNDIDFIQAVKLNGSKQIEDLYLIKEFIFKIE